MDLICLTTKYILLNYNKSNINKKGVKHIDKMK